jgi:hypothetical protein
MMGLGKESHALRAGHMKMGEESHALRAGQHREEERKVQWQYEAA